MKLQIGRAGTILIQAQQGATAIALTGAAVRAQLLDYWTQAPIGAEIVLTGAELGANWAAGIAAVPVPAETAALLSGQAVRLRITASLDGTQYEQTAVVAVQSAQEQASDRGSMFIRELAIAELRSSRLSMIPPSLVDPAKVSDESLWTAIRAAEQEAARLLACPLVPTTFFPIEQPTPAEIEALGGRPYMVEAGYDMEGDILSLWRFGTLRVRHRPLIKVEEMRFVYPGLNVSIYSVPLEWIYADRKAGILQFAAAPTATGLPGAVAAMNAAIHSTFVPQMIRIRYTAGLTEDHPCYLDVRDLIMRMSVMRLVKDAFKAQSESISGDGFSQSFSFDADKHEGAIENDLKGLRDRIHGVIFGVM